MTKYMCSHTLPAGTLQPEQATQMAQAALKETTVYPYRSFLNLTEGKAFCIMEAASQEELAAWFKKMEMPFDYIVPVELEGEHGTLKELGKPETSTGRRAA